MLRWLGWIGFAFVALLVPIFIGLASWEPFFALQGTAPAERQYRAEIIRDEFEVPHIHGATDADVAFGVAIAQSEDDFFTLQDVVAMAKGRYGAIAGEQGAAVDYVYHLLDARGTAQRHYHELPEDTRALFDAYAAGLNTYASKHPRELKLANLFPVNGEDIAAGFALRQPFFFGLANIIQPLVEGRESYPEYGPDIPGFPRDATGDAKSRCFQNEVVVPCAGYSESEEIAYSPLGRDSAQSGSNAFAIAPKKSGDGVTRLVSNSHQPWRGQVSWYELVVESGEGWHFAGANLPGTPYPVIGHNENLGWTYTVNRPDLTDIYQLQMDKSGKRYRIDGEWRDLESHWAVLPVKLGPIVLPFPRKVYRSAHGPVIKNDKGFFAIRYAGIDSIKSMDAFYREGKAKNLDEWLAVYHRMDIPNFNAVYADRAGNIAYIYNAAAPDRKPGSNWRGLLPGNDSSLIWQGSVAFDRIPKLINPASGWLYNSNNAPFTAAGAGSDLDPADFAPELGIELKQTNRSRRAWKLLSEPGLVDLARLRHIKYDTAYERAGYVGDLWYALSQLDLKGEPELAKARDLLMTWDFTADDHGAADSLALLMIKDFMLAEYQNKPLPDVREQLVRSVKHLQQYFGRIDPPMSELLRLRQGPGPFQVDLPLDGGSDTLRASTTWNVDPDGRLSVNHGDSFIMFAEWAPGKRVSSRSIQPFGAAVTRPGNPHYTDQSRLFVKHDLKPVHFWREDVLAHARQRYVVESN